MRSRSEFFFKVDGKRPSGWLWLGLWVAFFVGALVVAARMGNVAGGEIFGYDYATYLRQLRDPGWICYTGVRHPGLGLVTSPVVLVASLVRIAGERACDLFLLAVFAGVATFNALLVRRLGGVLALAVSLCFGLTWIWAAVPESFPIAQTTLLLALVVADVEWRGGASEGKIVGAWLALAAFASLVTLTNGPKILLAAFVCSRAVRARWRPILFGCAGLAAVGIAFFAVRMTLGNAAHPEAGKSVMGGVAQTLAWIPRNLSVGEWLWAVCRNLFLLPVQPQFLWADPSLAPALTVPGAVVATAIWVFAAVRIRPRTDSVIRAALVFFGVDLAIHGACGWGLAEGWIFAAHYLPLLAIALARSQSSISSIQTSCANARDYRAAVPLTPERKERIICAVFAPKAEDVFGA